MTALLEVSGISMAFDGFKAINNLSLNIEEGELRAIIGPNGAGKTTFMDIVTGKTKPDSGRVLWGTPPVNLLSKSESDIARIGIGRKFQRPTVFETQSVRDNLTMALKKDRSPLSVLFENYTSIELEKINSVADEITLTEVMDRRAGELSHGQKQWLEIGMLILQDPRLLLVDEPAAGMTLAEREHTTNILKRTAKSRAVIVVEHDMEFVRRLECKVSVLHEGSVLAEGSLAHVTADPRVVEVYLGR